jgi:hypothetical protein
VIPFRKETPFNTLSAMGAPWVRREPSTPVPWVPHGVSNHINVLNGISEYANGNTKSSDKIYESGDDILEGKQKNYFHITHHYSKTQKTATQHFLTT